jgi:hypothetical protein
MEGQIGEPNTGVIPEKRVIDPDLSGNPFLSSQTTLNFIGRLDPFLDTIV